MSKKTTKVEYKSYIYSNVGGLAPKNYNLVFDQPSEILFVCSGLSTAQIDTCFNLSPVQQFITGAATWDYKLRLTFNQGEYLENNLNLLLNPDTTVQIIVKYIIN